MEEHEPTPLGDAIDLAPGVRVAGDAMRFRAARSSGPGGQNVNKRSTKVELRVAVNALGLSARAEARLRQMAGSRLMDDEVVIASDEHRTQLRNKKACVERLRALVVHALHEPKKRFKTKPSKGSVERRLQGKRETSARKKDRRFTPEG